MTTICLPRRSLLISALAALVVLLAFMAPPSLGAQDVPDPRPEDVPYFYDASGVFSEDEQGTLQRDAKLLQSSNIPTLVYVREVAAEQASRENSQAFADEVRRSWAIESSAGADDGLVLLFSWVPGNPKASTVVQSYGEATFARSGLTPESIQNTIDTSVRSLIEQKHPFETMVYLMRETRYTGIYVPPPPPALGDTAQTVHDVLDWLAPAVAGITALVFGVLSLRFWKTLPRSRQVWTIVGLSLSVALLLWIASVRTQSDAGVASALAIVAILAGAVWLWTHAPFTTHGSTTVRRRNVRGTPRRMLKQRQTRAMQLRAAKVNHR
jgi:uncharacterized membrane protein YgcG